MIPGQYVTKEKRADVKFDKFQGLSKSADLEFRAEASADEPTIICDHGGKDPDCLMMLMLQLVGILVGILAGDVRTRQGPPIRRNKCQFHERSPSVYSSSNTHGQGRNIVLICLAFQAVLRCVVDFLKIWPEINQMPAQAVDSGFGKYSHDKIDVTNQTESSGQTVHWILFRTHWIVRM